MNDEEWINEFRTRAIALGKSIDSLGKFLEEEKRPKDIKKEQIEKLHKALHSLGDTLVNQVNPILKNFYHGWW